MTAGDGYNWKDRKAYKEYTERHWQKELPIWVRAMAVAGDTVVIAGPVAEPRMDADQVLAGEKGSRLMLVSRESGEVTNDIEMPAPPAWDGLAAVPGRIIISGIDGKLRCFSGQ
jgi:hypothetical protein